MKFDITITAQHFLGTLGFCLSASLAHAQDFDGLYRGVDDEGAKRGGIALKIEYAHNKLSGDITLLGEFKAKGKLQGEYSQGVCFLRSDLGEFVAYASANCTRDAIAGTLNITRKGEKSATVTSFSARARVSGLVASPLPGAADPSAVLGASQAPNSARKAPPPLEVYAAECSAIYRHGDSLANCINSRKDSITNDSITSTDLRYWQLARRCHPGLSPHGLNAIDLKRLALACEGRR
jgi:hypothetical protein